jgi:hypothetical protein
MSMEYIRATYGVPAKRGMEVVYRGVRGRIVSASHYVHVQFPGYSKPHRIHPTDEQLRYVESNALPQSPVQP